MSSQVQDTRLRNLLALCGRDQPIQEIWAFSNYNGGLDVYVQTVGSIPPDLFSHYAVPVQEPIDWWRAPSYQFIGLVSRPAWMPFVAPMSRL